MTIQGCPVVVKRVPETLHGRNARDFFGALSSSMEVGLCSMVLDCSGVRQMDSSAVYRLLCCLEDAIKRDGNVKLAQVPSGPKAILELFGVDRIFEFFDTNAEAVTSFRRPPGDVAPGPCVPFGSHRAPESAA